MRMEARIAKEMEVYQQRPSAASSARGRRDTGTPVMSKTRAPRSSASAPSSTPRPAREPKLDGSLALTVSIRSEGSVENVEITLVGSRCSTRGRQDRSDVGAVARSPDIKRDTDALHITRTWMFTKGDELRSE